MTENYIMDSSSAADNHISWSIMNGPPPDEQFKTLRCGLIEVLHDRWLCKRVNELIQKRGRQSKTYMLTLG